MDKLTRRGAILGLAVGFVALAIAGMIAVQCLPFRISFSAQLWQWHCADPVYSALLYLAFPANVLTNDLARAIYFAPLTLLVYAILGASMSYMVGLVKKMG